MVSPFCQAWGLLKSDEATWDIGTGKGAYYKPASDHINLDPKLAYQSIYNKILASEPRGEKTGEEVNRLAEEQFMGGQGKSFARQAAHEFGHAATYDEPEMQSFVTGQYAGGRNPKASQNITESVKETAATEYPAYQMNYPESSFLAHKNMLRQVKHQTVDMLHNTNPNFFGYNLARFGNTQEEFDMLESRLPGRLQEINRIINELDEKYDSLKAKEKAFREIMGVRARNSLIRIPPKAGSFPLYQSHIKDTKQQDKIRDLKRKGSPMDIAMRLLKNDDPHTHKCKHCDYPIYHHLQQGEGKGSDPPQEVWCNENDCGGECNSPSGFCEPGESLGKTYQSGEPIEATPESHPNRILLNGRWIDVNDWNAEHEREQQANKSAEGLPMVNWNDTWDSDIQTGEPMDIAMRLLKEEKPWDMYSDWRYLKNPDNPDLRSDEPFTCGLYPEHHRLAGEIDTDSMFGGCGKTKPLSEFTRHILTNPQWKTSGQRGPSHPDYGKIGPEQVICNDCKARSYARFAPLANAIQEHIEENPDFDPNTQELGKLPPGMKIPNEALVDPDEDKWRSDIETGEPMDLAWQMLKMPIVDTAAGVSVAYGDLDEAERERMQGHWSEGGPVGSAPFVNNRRDGPVEMTPNEYFDLLGAGSPDSKYRWTGRFPTKERNEKIASMVEALQSGAVMGAPRLAFGGDEDEPPELFRQGQEGGHRMEALRQMGHGDTPIPVWNWYTR